MPGFHLAALLLYSAAARAEPSLDAKIARVMAAPTVSSRVGPLETPLPIDLAEFLLDHPDLSAFIVRSHHIAPYVITMLGPRRSSADDGDGTSGIIDLASRTERRRVYYGEGVHRSRIFPPIRADAVIVMELEPARRAGCGPRIRSSFDVYVKLRNPILSGMVKALRVFVRATIIRKFSKAFLVADQVGRLLARDPQSVRRDVAAFPLSDVDRRRALRLIDALAPQPAACLGLRP